MEERFIDADTPFEKETISYDDLVIKQINVCRDILSKDEFGPGFKMSSANSQPIYTGDVKKESINSVDAFKRMMIPFLKGEFSDWIQQIEDEVKEKERQLGERIIFIKGHGEVKVKDAGMIDYEHPVNKELTLFKYDKARDLFEVLVRAYHANKALIKSFEEE